MPRVRRGTGPGARLGAARRLGSGGSRLRPDGRKTSWYTFIAPVHLGGIIAGCSAAQLLQLDGFARALGVAFQIQDDVLNLDAGSLDYGKELAGDLWEGKRTLILLHALRVASKEERQRAITVLGKRRPQTADGGPLRALLDELARNGEISAATRTRIAAAAFAGEVATKTTEDVAFLLDLIVRHGGLEFARDTASRYGADAQRRLKDCSVFLPASVHRDFLDALVAYVHTRER